MRIDWKIGVEIELLAPPGASRLTLADAIAAQCAGQVRRVLHQDSEPSRVPGQPLFYNLTQGFEVLDPGGALVVRCVDDLTLQDDLDRQAQPRPGWWRIVSDDARLLRMLGVHTHAELDLPDALQALAPLFDGELIAAEGGMYRLIDPTGAPLAIAAPLPGERERPCELITPPLLSDHGARLEALLATARRLGFCIPREGATHIHFDAAVLRDAGTMANLVNSLQTWGPCLRRLCGTPSTFRRVGGFPPELLACVNSADFRGLPWSQAQERLRALGLSKYCDFNLRNIAHARADRHTFEARIFPATLDAAEVIAAAALVEGIVRRCQAAPVVGAADAAEWTTAGVAEWLDSLPLNATAAMHWRERAASAPTQS